MVITGANSEAADAQECLLAPAPCRLGQNAWMYPSVMETKSQILVLAGLLINDINKHLVVCQKQDATILHLMI